MSGYLGTGLVLEVTVDGEGAFAGGQIIATRQEGEGVPVLDPAGKSIDLVRQLSAEDFPQYGVQVGQDGSIGQR